eukprot:gene7556-7713_t
MVTKAWTSEARDVLLIQVPWFVPGPPGDDKRRS